MPRIRIVAPPCSSYPAWVLGILIGLEVKGVTYGHPPGVAAPVVAEEQALKSRDACFISIPDFLKQIDGMSPLWCWLRVAQVDGSTYVGFPPACYVLVTDTAKAA